MDDNQYRKNIKGNNFWSVFGLVSSHTIRPVLILGFLMVILQFGIFLNLGMNQGETVTALNVWTQNGILRLSFWVIFILTLMNGSAAGCGSGKPEYTLRRLGVSRSILFPIWMLNLFLLFVILWGLQLLSLFAGSYLYMAVTPEAFTSAQTIYLSSFRSEFFHMVMPMGDWAIWIRNIVGILILSAVGAYWSMNRIYKNEGSI